MTIVSEDAGPFLEVILVRKDPQEITEMFFSMIPVGVSFVIYSGIFFVNPAWNITSSFNNRTNFQICEGNGGYPFPSTRVQHN